MRLYAGMSVAFVEDTVRNQIARKLSDAFFHITATRQQSLKWRLGVIRCARWPK